MDARKQALDAEAAWALLRGGENVFAARGKAVKSFRVSEDQRADILKAAMGPSGNLRAPTFKVGQAYVVGFNEQMYQEQLLD